MISTRTLLKNHVAQVAGARFDGDTCVSFAIDNKTIDLFLCDVSDYPNTKGVLSTQDESIAGLIEQNQRVTGDIATIVAGCRRLLETPPHFAAIPDIPYDIYTRAVYDDSIKCVTKYFVARLGTVCTVVVEQSALGANTLHLVDCRYTVSEDNVTRIVEKRCLSAWTVADYCTPLLASTSVNITRLLDAIRKRASELLDRCMICHTAFNHKRLRPGVCDAELCEYQMITYCLGVAPTLEIVHRGPVVDLLVQLALVSGAKCPVGDLACLQALPSTKDMLELVYRNDLEATLGRRMPQFFWVLASNRADIELSGDLSVPGYICFKITLDDPEKEARFQKCKREHANNDTPLYAFHGSSVSNWHSILRTGLNYDKVTNGRAYGNGMYFSTSMATARGYAQSQKGSGWQNSVFDVSACISVNELVNAPNKFVSRDPHLVVNDIDWVQVRYLLVATNPAKSFAPMTHSASDTVQPVAIPLTDTTNRLLVLYRHDGDCVPVYATSTATKSIMRELQGLPQETEWFRYTRDRIENIYQWPFTMCFENLPPVTFEVTFPPAFPMEPPFVRVVLPRFVPFAQGGGGHITAGGSICSEFLTTQGWLPSYSLEKVFYQIFIEISLAEPPAVVENVTGSYSRTEAWSGFERAARTHNWAYNSGNRKYFVN